jgi:hypothetical protein
MTEQHPYDCAALDQSLDRYLAGGLAEQDALALEEHAAGCAACGAALEAATRRDWCFAPAVPEALRHTTLDAVERKAAQMRTRSSRNHRIIGYVTGLSSLAAAVLIAVLLRSSSSAPSADGNVASTESLSAEGAGVVAVVERIAGETAKSEFIALDAAAAELSAALTRAPEDLELLEYLAAIRARRNELQRRVAEAAS